MIKAFAMVMSFSSVLSALDPGCGASASVAPANGGSATPVSSITPTGDTMICGSLGAHTFCDDFSGDLPSHFERQDVTAGNLAISGQALHASTIKPAFGTRTQARLVKDVATSGTRFQLAFTETLSTSCLDPGNRVDTAAIAVDGGKHIFVVGHGKDGDSIVETSLDGGIYVHAHALRSPLPHGRTLHLLLDLDTTQKTVSLAVDGQTVVDREPLTYPPTGTDLHATVYAGLLVDNLVGPSACDVTTDDLTLDVAR